MNDCFFRDLSKIYGKIWAGFCLNTGKCFSLAFWFYRDFKALTGSFKIAWENIWEIGMFLCDKITWNFERFQYFNFWNKFSEKRKPFSKNWSTTF